MAKSAQAFRTISEAAEDIGVAQHVLRFWETKFTFIRPMKRAGGRRFYRPADIAVLAIVRRLLHEDGYSIKEVQALYRQTRFKVASGAQVAPAPATSRATGGLRGAVSALAAAKARLDRALGGARRTPIL